MDRGTCNVADEVFDKEVCVMETERCYFCQKKVTGDDEMDGIINLANGEREKVLFHELCCIAYHTMIERKGENNSGAIHILRINVQRGML